MQKFIKLFNFCRYIRISDKEVVEPYHLLVVDGPSSIAISKLIIEKNTALRFKCIVSANFVTRLKSSDALLENYMVGWQVSTIIIGLFQFLGLLIKCHKFPNISQVTALSNSECIRSHLIRNAQHIKNVIVFNERSPFSQHAVLTAKKYGIYTSCIQHGAVVENYFPIYVDRYFTWSEYYSNILQERSPGLNTVCVGRLGYQVLDGCSKERKIHGPLLVLQPADVSIVREDLLSHFKKIIDVCYKYNDEITLRPHPNDNIMQDIISYIGDRKYAINYDPLGDVLSSHLITISIYSTVLFEAPHYGSLPIQYLETRYSNELMRRCEISVSSPEKLEYIFNDIKNDKLLLNKINGSLKFSNERMKSGNIGLFFYSLECERV